MSIFPSSPTIGDEYSGYRWDGAVWQVIGLNVAAVPQSYVQTDPPTLPREGSIWLDTDSTANATDATYPTIIYSSSEPSLGIGDAGTVWTDPSNNNMRVWDGTSWVYVIVSFTYAATAPAGPITGQVWVDSNTSMFYVYDGSSWIQTVTLTTYSASSPSSPVTGQIWIDSSDGVLYVWNGSSWQNTDTNIQSEIDQVRQIAVSAKTLALLGL